MKSMIRRESPGDIEAIRALLMKAFPTPAEALLVDLLRDAGHLLVSLVAESDGILIGHAGFSPVKTASGQVGAGLAPLAVAEGFRRRGVAAELVQAGLNSCANLGFGWAVVLGERDYYARFGFLPASSFGLSDNYGGGDHFQATELIPGMLPVGTGPVSYSPEFASLGSG